MRLFILLCAFINSAFCTESAPILFKLGSDNYQIQGIGQFAIVDQANESYYKNIEKSQGLKFGKLEYAILPRARIVEVIKDKDAYVSPKVFIYSVPELLTLQIPEENKGDLIDGLIKNFQLEVVDKKDIRNKLKKILSEEKIDNVEIQGISKMGADKMEDGFIGYMTSSVSIGNGKSFTNIFSYCVKIISGKAIIFSIVQEVKDNDSIDDKFLFISSVYSGITK